jgi:phosphoribosylglycinamide formyltransferase-1
VKSIVILISGRGTNLKALIDAARLEDWPARIVAVISSREHAAGLAVALKAGIAVDVVDAAAHPDRLLFDQKLAQALSRHQPDLVLLAGFMRILSEDLVRDYHGRMLNIHPSLLPAFKGLHTHRQALAAGVRVHGATVHFVVPELDHGPIIAQAAVPVFPEDSESALAARVLAEEHRLYPRVVRWMLDGRLALVGSRVRVDVPQDQLLLDGIVKGVRS